MLPPVLQKIQALREQALVRCAAIAENCANIITLSDKYTKLAMEGGVTPGSSSSTTLGPAGYTETLSGATVAPVSIVNAGNASPANAALVMEIEHVD